MTTATRTTNRITSKKSAKTAPAVAKLRKHVTGAIKAGKAQAIVEVPVAATGKKPNAICYCGCNTFTKSPKSRFVQGHDAVLKSRSLAVARQQIDTHIDELSAALPHDDARDYFHKHVEAERKVIAAKAKTAKK